MREKVLSADNQQGRLENMSSKLSPQYILGFVDGEGSFHVAIYKDSRMKSGIKFIPEFHVSQQSTSRSVLDGLKEYFDCGYVKANHAANNRDNTYVYVVRDRDSLLKKIIPFFKKNPLKTKKNDDFHLFADIVNKMELGQHRNLSGAKKLLNLAYQMNQGGKYRRQRHVI